MNLELTIRGDGAAFEDDSGFPEMARILRRIAGQLESGQMPETVRDINGNRCGAILFTERN